MSITAAGGKLVALTRLDANYNNTIPCKNLLSSVIPRPSPTNPKPLIRKLEAGGKN